MALCFLASIQPAEAFQFKTGNPDLRIAWDNTIKYSMAFRVEGRSDTLVDVEENPSNLNQDDGDRNFNRGLISQRIDLYSEFDLIYKKFGFRVSGAAWYDFVYNTKNDNDSKLTANAYSVPHDEFTDDTRDLHGRYAELLDAFVFGSFTLGPTNTSVRVGQFGMMWGETLFFGPNGIAGGMAPYDLIKLLSVPNSQFKEVIRPVPQVSVQLQIGPRVTLGGYYQLGWEASRLPAVGSYFSTGDILDVGGERLLVLPVFGWYKLAFLRGDDMDAKDSGQGGVQLKVRPGLGLDLGFYAIRYHDKGPQIYLKPLEGFNLRTGQIGQYFLAYPEDIEAYGMSVSRTFGDWNLATEVSMRRNTPLVSTVGVILPALPPIFPGMNLDADNDDNPAYAVGRSVHVNFSWFAVFAPNFIARESAFLGEVAWNHLESITENPDALDPNAEKDAVGFRMVYTPTYRQVLPNLDLSIPIGLSYFPMGKSSVVPGFGWDEGGDVSIGLSGSYLDVWRFSLSYTHFYGPEGSFLNENLNLSFKQSLGDRGFVALSFYRTF